MKRPQPGPGIQIVAAFVVFAGFAITLLNLAYLLAIPAWVGVVMVAASVGILLRFNSSAAQPVRRALLLLAVVGSSILLASLRPGAEPSGWALLGAALAFPGAFLFARSSVDRQSKVWRGKK